MVLNKLTINQLKSYTIDCMGYSEEDLQEMNKRDIMDLIEAMPGNDEACIQYNN